MRKFTSYLVFCFHDSAIERDHSQSNDFVEGRSLQRLSEACFASAVQEREEAEVLALRRSLVVRAQPMPFFNKPFKPRK
jgi:hypothetical protein